MASTLARFESSRFLPVGAPKHLVYPTPAENEEAHRTVDACQTIRNHPAISERMRMSMMRRVEACIENLMEDFLRTYYKSTLSAINHKFNVSGQRLIWTFLVLVRGTRAQSLSAPFSYILDNAYSNRLSLQNFLRSQREYSVKS
jgi:hypothetical protein